MMKHILRIGLVLMLMAAMLLGVSSVAYADPGDGPDMVVIVEVEGDNVEVGVDLYGDDNTAEVTFHSENPTVLINGHDLNDPVAVYNVSNTSAASSMGVKRLVKDVMFPYMQDTWERLNLTADGLAKVILLAQSHESDITNIETQISNSISDRLNDQGERLIAVELEAASQAGQIETLKAQDAAIQARITAEVSYVIDSYNKLLAIIVGAFSAVVIGLGTGLWLTRRRTY